MDKNTNSKVEMEVPTEVIEISSDDEDHVRGETMTNNGFLVLGKTDFQSLHGKNHVNDKIIDEYLHLIEKRGEQPRRKQVMALPCHAYTWLEADFARNFSTVLGWLKKNIQSVDIVLVPINTGNKHWSLLAFYPDERKLYFDSLIRHRLSSNAPLMQCYQNFLLDTMRLNTIKTYPSLQKSIKKQQSKQIHMIVEFLFVSMLNRSAGALSQDRVRKTWHVSENK